MPMISGISYWAKVHKPAVDDYNPDGIYSIDVAVDSKTEAQLKKLGLGKRIKIKKTIVVTSYRSREE